MGSEMCIRDSGTTIAALQGLRFVTATNGAPVCACVRIMWACHPEHNEGQIQPALALNCKRCEFPKMDLTAAVFYLLLLPGIMNEG